MSFNSEHALHIDNAPVELGPLEALLERCPGVQRAIIVGRTVGDRTARVMAFITLSAENPENAESRQSQRICDWHNLFDSIYSAESRLWSSPHAGWNAAVTRRPIESATIREWADVSAARILTYASVERKALRKLRICEIGCGTGAMILRLAPYCERYVATDFSKAALDRIGDLGWANELPQLRLEHCPADHDHAKFDAPFDVIVLNSVVQYFPSQSYLRLVVNRAASSLAEDGLLFIGDVRSLELAALLYREMNAYRAPSLEGRSGYAAARPMPHAHAERELLVSPRFFGGVASDLGLGSKVLLRAGRSQSEMLRYRYDALLFKPRRLASDCFEIAWSELRTFEAFRNLLCSGDDHVRISAVPNARLRHVLSLAQNRATHGEDWLDPEEAIAAAQAAGYLGEASWACASEDGSFDLVLSRPPEAGIRVAIEPLEAVRRPESVKQPGSMGREEQSLSNEPLASTIAGRLQRLLIERLGEQAPGWAIRARVETLPSLPLSSEGKPDRSALQLAFDRALRAE